MTIPARLLSEPCEVVEITAIGGDRPQGRPVGPLARQFTEALNEMASAGYTLLSWNMTSTIDPQSARQTDLVVAIFINHEKAMQKRVAEFGMPT